MLTKLAMILICALSFVCVPHAMHADPLNTYTITAYDPSTGALTLSDGSQWTFSPNLPKSPWAVGSAVIVQPMAEGFPITGFAAVLYNLPEVEFSEPIAAVMNSGSNQLTITSLDKASGVAVLSDGTKWQLDPSFKPYYNTWQIGDPITPSVNIQNVLINGNSRQKKGVSCMSYASAIEKPSQAKP